MQRPLMLIVVALVLGTGCSSDAPVEEPTPRPEATFEITPVADVDCAPLETPQRVLFSQTQILAQLRTADAFALVSDGTMIYDAPGMAGAIDAMRVLDGIVNMRGEVTASLDLIERANDLAGAILSSETEPTQAQLDELIAGSATTTAIIFAQGPVSLAVTEAGCAVDD